MVEAPDIVNVKKLVDIVEYTELFKLPFPIRNDVDAPPNVILPADTLVVTAEPFKPFKTQLPSDNDGRVPLSLYINREKLPTAKLFVIG